MSKFYFILLLTSLLCSASRGDVNIVTTIKPLQMIAEAVVQETGQVSSIVDPLQSPHHFSVSPSDRIALAQADLAIWIGPQFETYISDFFARPNFKAKTITIIEIPELRLHTVGDGQLDGHLWLDTSNAIRIATAIAERAAIIDPANALSYRENLQNFATGIESSNAQLTERFQLQPRSNYAVYHNAYQYFERQFALQHDMVILQGPEVQPGIREIVDLRKQVKKQQISCLLLESNSSADLISTVLNGHELKSITVDLLGSNVIANENSYSDFIAKLADDFYQCLYK
tara:strand:+ start:2101 stop:2961 length:861 start_codon:yes stop_codon:yes gene_type:complete